MLIVLLSCALTGGVLQSIFRGARFSEFQHLPTASYDRESLAMGVSHSGTLAVIAVEHTLYLTSTKSSKISRSVRIPDLDTHIQWIRFSPDDSLFAVSDGYVQRVYSTQGLKLVLIKDGVGFSYWQKEALIGVRLGEDGSPSSLVTLLGSPGRPTFPKNVWPVFGTNDRRMYLCVRKRRPSRHRSQYEAAAYEKVSDGFVQASDWYNFSDDYPSVGWTVTNKDRFGRFVMGHGGVATNKSLTHAEIVACRPIPSLDVSRSLMLDQHQVPFWQPGFVIRDGCIGVFLRIATVGPTATVENTVFVSVGASRVFWKVVPFQVYAVAQSKAHTWFLFQTGSQVTVAHAWK